MDRLARQGYNQGALIASLKDSWPRSLTLLAGSLLLCALGCGPKERGPWRARDPEAHSRPDLEILSCRPSQNCEYRWRSFSGDSWELSNPSPAAARWLWTDGRWSSHPQKDALLEICWAPNAKAACLNPRPGDAGPRSTPRWLILPSPVESYGRGGMGTRKVRHTWSRQPVAVRRAIRSGAFDAVLSLGSHGSELIRDLERATIRSARQWLPRRIFALALAFHRPTRGADISIAGRSHRPEFWSTRNDLQVQFQGLRYRRGEIELAFVRDNQEASFKLPRLAPLLDPLRARSQVSPCLGCGPRRDAILDAE